MKKITPFKFHRTYTVLLLLLFSIPDTFAQCPEDITVDNDAGVCGAVVTYEIEGGGEQLSENGIVNPSGANGFTGWTVTNGGSGWGINAEPAFITSYALCSMNQVIDLTTLGITDEYMDTQPAITVSDEYSGTSNNPADSYFLTVELRGEANNVIATYTTGTITTTGNWQTATHTFTGYGPGVRKVYFSHGGDDAEFWAGQYGSKMKNASVRVSLPTSTIVQTAGLESGELFPVGTTLNSFEITDEDDNVTTCSFNVTVTDAEAPLVAVQDVTVTLDENGEAVITADTVDDGSFENCADTAPQLDITSFNCENLGQNTVTMSLSDENTTTTATATVTVVDDSPPNIAAIESITLNLDENGTAVLTTEDVDTGSTDNCSIASYVLSQQNFDADDIGDTEITYTVYDTSGNASETTITVTVQDNAPPTVAAQNITLELNQVTLASISAADIYTSATDNTGIVSYTLDKQIFTCADLGENEVTLTVTDGYGNEATATVIVTVTDPNDYCQLSGIDDVLAASLKIYPNPTDGLIRIESADFIVNSVDVYDVSGRMVKSFQPNSGQDFEVDITQMHSGLYILVLNVNDKVATYKITRK